MGEIIMDVILLLLPTLILTWFSYDYIAYRKYMREHPDSNNSPTEPIPEKLVLRRTNAKLSASQQKKATIIGMLVALSSISLIFTVFIIVPVVDTPKHEQAAVFNKLISKLSAVIFNDPFNLFFLILFFLSIPVSYLIPRYIQDEKLILNKQGISYSSPAPNFLKFLFPDWVISWANIDKIILGNRMVIGTLAIHELENNTKRRLIPATWKIKTETRTYNGFFVQGKENRRVMNDKDYIMQSPMIKFINKHTHLSITNNNKPDSALNFELSNQKEATIVASMVILTVILSVIGFMTMSLMEIHTAMPPWLIYSPAAAIAFFSFLYLRTSKIPKSVILALPLFLGVVSASACYPASLLINRLTDKNGLHDYVYIKSTKYKFSPVNSALPEIDIDRFEFGKTKYWDSIKIDDSYEFQLRKGGLGFYQLAKEPIRIKSVHWHCVQRIEKNGGDPKECDDISFF